MTETIANGYSSESTQRDLSNEYQHERVKKIFIIFCFFVHWPKVTSAAEGLIRYSQMTSPSFGGPGRNWINPLMPRAAVNSLTILMKSSEENHS